MTDEREAWERRDSESAESFEAFSFYRDQGADRSLRSTAQYLRKSNAVIMAWSRRDSWVQRCVQYDAYLDSIRRREAEEAIVAMSHRHAESLERTWKILAAPAVELATRLEDPEDKTLKELTTSELLSAVATIGRVMPRLVQAERLVRGISTENVAEADAAQAKTLEEAEAYLLGMDDGAAGLEQASTDAPLALPPGSEDDAAGLG
jgi:hypothetical protein